MLRKSFAMLLLIALIARADALRVGVSSGYGEKSATARREALAYACTSVLAVALPASASYGQMADFAGSGAATTSAAEMANGCLFQTTGICLVYRSDKPKLWDAPDTKLAMGKLQKAISDLDGLGELIEKQRWSQISQVLGASRDLREAMSFLTRSNTVKEGEAGFAKSADENKEAAALAKKVFKDLETVQLASSKKLPDVAKKAFVAYQADMPKLLNALD